MKRLTKKEKYLHESFIQYGLNAKKWMQKCVLLLPEIQKEMIWKKKGFLSIYEYAAKLAGMSHRTVNEALRIMEKIEDKPKLRKVVEKKGLWAVKPVVTIATKETDEFWAKKAEGMSCRTLETFVREVRNSESADMLIDNCSRRHVASIDTIEKSGQSIFGNGNDFLDDRQDDRQDCSLIFNNSRFISVSENSSEKIIVSMDLSPSLVCELEKLKTVSWDETIKYLLEFRKNALECEKPQSVKTRSRAIPAAIERYILKRSNRKCEFPCCAKIYSELHHTGRFGLVHAHDPDRIFALCREHHNLAHRGLISNEDRDIREWCVRAEADRTDLKYMIDQKVLEYI